MKKGNWCKRKREQKREIIRWQQEKEAFYNYSVPALVPIVSAAVTAVAFPAFDFAQIAN